MFGVRSEDLSTDEIINITVCLQQSTKHMYRYS